MSLKEKNLVVIILIASLNLSTRIFSQSQENLIKLTNIETSYPYWSPDGEKIVFQSNRLDDNSEIYTMDKDGKNIKRLTFSKGLDENPIWSPDGNHILFVSSRDGNHEVYLMDADGKNQQNLTRHLGYDGHPNFSPDGKRIIFNSNRVMPAERYRGDPYTKDSNVELFEMDLDGQSVKRVTNYFSWDSYPDISPDGQKIAFRRRVETQIMGKTVPNSEVFISNRDGSEAYNISNHPEHDGWPAWSPDGKKIAFSSERKSDRNWQIYTINTDGSGLKRLTNFQSQDAYFTKPQWSPDGTKILCTRTKDGNVEVFVLNLENSN